MPAARSWYVAFGCTADKNALGSNDLDVISTDASADGTLIFGRVEFVYSH
jgi:hypothetical protein